MTEVIVEPVEPVTWGCTVDDVLRLLPGVVITDGLVMESGPSNPHYRGTGRRITREDVQEYIRSVASRVSARVWRFDAAPDRFRDNLRLMARDLVANGAASYVQAALYPAGTGSNDGGGYAGVLWARFQTELDDLAAQVEDAVTNPGEDGLGVGGPVSSSGPAPFFSDELRF